MADADNPLPDECNTIPRRISITVSAVIWLLVGLLTCELAGRILYRNGQKAAGIYSGNQDVRWISEAFHRELWETPWLRYKPGAQAGISVDGIDYRVTINELGFRGQAPTPSTDKPFVIACIGGSTTVEGATDETTYPAMLELYLNKLGYGVSVVNCGISGMTADDYPKLIRDMLVAVEPDLVVEYNAVNDICHGIFRSWSSQHGTFKKMLLHSQAARYLLGDHLTPSTRTARRDIQATMITPLVALSQLLNDNSIELAVVTFAYPTPAKATRREYSYLDHNLRYWWDSQHISYKKYCSTIDLYNDSLKAAFSNDSTHVIPLAEGAQWSLEDFADICHMTESGRHKKAKMLAAHLAPIISAVQSSHKYRAKHSSNRDRNSAL